ncbi:MAG: dienelactone hydrolase [Cyclobacteriaceae bacterium]|nr:MAG: dienelactone hydrolase [Cyclobacteriaceae bacterium]
MNSQKRFTIWFAVLFLLTAACKEKQQNTEEVPNENVVEEISLRGEVVNYSVDTTELTGYIVYENSHEKKRPGVIVIHEWWGHNDYVRERADMLAEAGYTALALDMYGDGKLAEHPDDAGKFAGMVMSNMDLAQTRFDAAMELLKSHPTVDNEQIAAIGYCFGGSVALTMANAGKDLDAVAAFHSGVELPIMPGADLKAAVLVCNGAEDPFISEESVTAFKEAMDAAGADYKYISYPGAVHSFTSKRADAIGEKFDMPLKYQKQADEASWQELQQLLNRVF